VPSADKLYLVGFMGAGKSSVGRALGQRLGWRVIDIDAWIEERERQPVADIFAARGEAAFRALERGAVRAALAPRHVVVATGSGTFADATNRAAVLDDGTVVWLDAPFETVVARVPADGRRPLARDREAFAALYASRVATYRLAHVRIDTAAAVVDEVVERILDRLGW
jgi:shikimate kinase